MIFSKTKFDGVFVIELERLKDERGFFARSFDAKKFEDLGLSPKIVQCNISFNEKRGTIRGMHYQAKPFEEDKTIRCTKGSIFDVVIDLREQSKTFKKWLGINLSAAEQKMIYIPKGFAHGFQTLEDNTEVFYQMSEFFTPECSRGIRWDDATFQIKWPLKSTMISEKDRAYKSFTA